MIAIKRTPLTVLAVLLAGSLLTGFACERKDDAKPTTPKPPTPDVTPKAGGAADAGKAAGGMAKGPATGPSAATAPSVTRTPSDLDLPPVTRPTDKASAEQSKQAQDLVAKAIVAIQEDRLDDARAALDRVDAMGDAVQKTTREQAKTARASLENVARLQQTDLPLPAEGENK